MGTKQKSPLVSIIAICYNQAKFAIETLESVRAQTYHNIQLIIIDDCSTDNSVELIQSWITKNNVQCEFVKHVQNMGVTKTCNDGLNRVEGMYYQVIACDDIMMPEKIERQIAILIENNAVGVVHSNGETINEDGEKIKDRYHSEARFFGKPENVFRELLQDNRILAPSVLIRVSCIPNKKNAYDESLIFEDWYMWLKLAEKYEFYYLDEVLVRYRILSHSLVRDENKRTKIVSDTIQLISRYLGVTEELDEIISTHVLKLKRRYQLYEFSFKAIIERRTPPKEYLRRVKRKLLEILK